MRAEPCVTSSAGWDGLAVPGAAFDVFSACHSFGEVDGKKRCGVNRLRRPPFVEPVMGEAGDQGLVSSYVFRAGSGAVEDVVNG